MIPGNGFTETIIVLLQPVSKVYVIVALTSVPVTPVLMTPEEVIGATVVLLLAHVPPPPSESV
jgi:hypothetical protein